ncbi:hypothetical protein J2R99_001479 [Rhodopseudomonas julia]|uniref:Anti-sigma factor NepR domain-containing protein n=1 Tax=Rhodopseudomonas julia TaxID=200617 RepID=A0ABU0C560_9BRAD|nr:hypothetical protein [Rhodopseudomonas julia]MDQ0325630.1 hypothetical protein [Rhodopseudomonas julia]
MESSPNLVQDDSDLQRQLAKLGEEVLTEDVPERLLQALTGAVQTPEELSGAAAGERTAVSSELSPFTKTKRDD